jgi:hypothetical protein
MATDAPAVPAASSADDQRIVRAAIYPPIGIGRVGNSEEEYFLAPEVPDPLPEAPGFYRDGEGALKRQAARFRSGSRSRRRTTARCKSPCA